MKKIICIILAFVMLAFAITSCSNVDIPIIGKKIAGVYNQYSNLVRIDQFHNGLAAFMIHNPGSNLRSLGLMSKAWYGNYYFGYIDTKGNVVIEPVYECAPTVTLPAFYSEYIRIEDLDDHEYLIDKKGNVKFEVGKNDVTGIGNVSEGYFWIETAKEDISGSSYTVSYYRASDLSVVATYNNVRAFNELTYTPGESTLSKSGDAVLIQGSDYRYNDNTLTRFNISEHDSGYKSSYLNWSVNPFKISNFSSAAYIYHHPSSTLNDNRKLATVTLENSNGTLFYSIIDDAGNVLMQPQKNIAFPIESRRLSYEGEMNKYDFCKNLCPAKDIESGYWGYIDPHGNWKIQPQYSSAASFSADGYATVNNKIVINTEGKVVLSPAGWTNEKVTSLSGTYKYDDIVDSYQNWYITFSEDGTLKLTMKAEYYGTSNDTCKYQIKGGTLIVSELASWAGAFYKIITEDGEYTFIKEGDTIFINGSRWELSNS